MLDLALAGLPRVGEAVPQALAVTPEQSVEDAVEEPVQVEALQVLLSPDALQRQVHIVSHDVQHLSESRRKKAKVLTTQNDLVREVFWFIPHPAPRKKWPNTESNSAI